MGKKRKKEVNNKIEWTTFLEWILPKTELYARIIKTDTEIHEMKKMGIYTYTVYMTIRFQQDDYTRLYEIHVYI